MIVDRMPILEDLQDVAPLLILERGERPIIDEQHVHARELAEEADVGAVGHRDHWDRRIVIRALTKA
jgi:hypothetical protein